MLQTNVTGAFNCIRAVAPEFRQQHYGKIVSISAHQAERPGFGVANYAASKAALAGLTRAAAVELGPANVNVNAVAPGFVRTERMNDAAPRKSSSGPSGPPCSAGWPTRRTWPTPSPGSAPMTPATSPGRCWWWMGGCRWESGRAIG